MSQRACDFYLSDEERRALRFFVEKLGERATLKELSLSRQALGRLLAGLPVRRGTLALVRAGMSPSGEQAERGKVGSKSGKPA